MPTSRTHWPPGEARAASGLPVPEWPAVLWGHPERYTSVNGDWGKRIGGKQLSNCDHVVYDYAEHRCLDCGTGLAGLRSEGFFPDGDAVAL